MADGFDMQSCVLSRTDAGGEKYRKPKHAAKGFPWYIRMSPSHGGGIIAYFKDVEMGMIAMEFLEELELEDADKGLPLLTNDDLVNIRRCIGHLHGWPLLPEL
jgi:hypothetical protein